MSPTSLDHLIYPFLTKAAESGDSIRVTPQLHRLIWESMSAKTTAGIYADPPRYHPEARMEHNGVPVVIGDAR